MVPDHLRPKVNDRICVHIIRSLVKTGAELSRNHHLVVNWIRWQVRLLDRPGKLKRGVRVNWECLVEATIHQVPLLEEFLAHPREARRAVDSAVTETKTWLWEEFRKAMEKDFRLASRKFWQTIQECKAGLGPSCVYPGRRTAHPDWGYS